MQIIKVVNNDKKYTKELNGVKKEFSSINYYIELDNKIWIPFRPSFSKGYAQLDTIAKVIINGKQ